MKSLIAIPLLVFSLAIQSQNINVSKGNVFDGEPYLAINPNNSDHLVIAWMSWINLMNRFQIKTITSFDAGLTWSLPVTLPHTEENYSSADPCIAFNKNGDVFVTYIDFTGTTPPVTGGVYLSKSIDGGLTWNRPTEVIHSNFDGSKWPIDRPWMIIDPNTSGDSTVIYLTTFNLNRTQPRFNPYLSVSSDGGTSFQTRYLDTTGWLAGNLNPFPMCSPAVSNNGIFYGVYPSFALIQSPFFELFLVSSKDQGLSLDHNSVLTQTSPPSALDYPFAKKGGLLLCDPSNGEHLSYITLGADHGDLDVFFSESYDAGLNWSDLIRINDDPIGNNRMQDMIWGDYDKDGDLVISWRDRRSGTDSTFQTSSEIWASYKMKDSSHFSDNFQITNQIVPFDSILENAGNDFMSIKLQDDILNANWGDTRNGKLNIWFQSMTIGGLIISSQQVSPFKEIAVSMYPNPTTDEFVITGEQIYNVSIYDVQGNLLQVIQNDKSNSTLTINTRRFTSGMYFIQVHTKQGITTKSLVKE